MGFDPVGSRVALICERVDVVLYCDIWSIKSERISGLPKAAPKNKIDSFFHCATSIQVVVACLFCIKC